METYVLILRYLFGAGSGSAIKLPERARTGAVVLILTYL